MKRKGKLAAIALLFGATAIGGTWAYFNQTLTVTNEFDTGTYDTELVEEFKPSDGENWEPGTEVNKDVTVKNSGTLPVVVRVKFEEKWERDGEDEPFYKVDTTDKDDMVDPDPTGRNKFENVYQSSPQKEDDAPDGIAGKAIDDSVVHKAMNVSDYAIQSDCWVYNPNDGYYYYTGVLAGSVENADGTTTYDETSLLLDSVTLCENVDMGYYEEIKKYATDSNASKDDEADWAEFEKEENGSYYSTSKMSEWVKSQWPDDGMIYYMKSVTQVDPDRMGYSNAEYTLTITAQTVQATKNAVKTAFGEVDYWGDSLTSDEPTN